MTPDGPEATAKGGGTGWSLRVKLTFGLRVIEQFGRGPGRTDSELIGWPSG